MVIDDTSKAYLSNLQDRDIAGMLNGVYGFFGNKFVSPDNIKACINEHGFHMTYKGVDYSMKFSKEDNLYFKMEVNIEVDDPYLGRRINEGRVSNRQLDESSKYLASQKIDANGKNVYVDCRIKRTPKTDSDIGVLCDQLWGLIVQPVMASVSK